MQQLEHVLQLDVMLDVLLHVLTTVALQQLLLVKLSQQQVLVDLTPLQRPSLELELLLGAAPANMI
jgi:hypothetical protein